MAEISRGELNRALVLALGARGKLVTALDGTIQPVVLIADITQDAYSYAKRWAAGTQGAGAAGARGYVLIDNPTDSGVDVVIDGIWCLISGTTFSELIISDAPAPALGANVNITRAETEPGAAGARLAPFMRSGSAVGQGQVIGFRSTNFPIYDHQIIVRPGTYAGVRTAVDGAGITVDASFWGRLFPRG